MWVGHIATLDFSKIAKYFHSQLEKKLLEYLEAC